MNVLIVVYNFMCLKNPQNVRQQKIKSYYVSVGSDMVLSVGKYEKIIKERNRVMRARAHLYTVIIKRMKGTEEKMLLYSGPVFYGIAVGLHTSAHVHTRRHAHTNF